MFVFYQQMTSRNGGGREKGVTQPRSLGCNQTIRRCRNMHQFGYECALNGWCLRDFTCTYSIVHIGMLTFANSTQSAVEAGGNMISV